MQENFDKGKRSGSVLFVYCHIKGVLRDRLRLARHLISPTVMTEKYDASTR